MTITQKLTHIKAKLREIVGNELGRNTMTIDDIKQELKRELSICDEWLIGGGHLLPGLHEKRKLAKALLTAIDSMEEATRVAKHFCVASIENGITGSLQTIREQWDENQS